MSSSTCELTIDPPPISELLQTASLYFHIPFCHTRCHYCDFNTYAGILPSLLSVEQIARVLTASRAAFAVDEEAEISLEANPGTLSLERLQGLRAAGVNRLSMGAQSFDAELLRALGRIHSPGEITQAVLFARQAGFSSINLDFMFGLPEQTMRQWQETLDEALKLRPEHLSLYSLIIEEGTPFAAWTAEGRITPGDEDLCADMYEYAEERLRAEGYVNYEISNWSLPGHQCQHNLTYWYNLPYIGMGAGAHSSFAGKRFSDVLDPQEYIRLLKAGQMPVAESSEVSRLQEMTETSFLGLRTAMGLHLPTFAQRFGESFAEFVGERLRAVDEAGLLEHAGDWLRLSERGRLLGNEVFFRLLPD